ncbi:Protein KOKOPELLI [Glycine soja]
MDLLLHIRSLGCSKIASRTIKGVKQMRIQILVEKGIKVHMLNFEDHVYKLLLEGWVSLIAKEPEPENKGKQWNIFVAVGISLLQFVAELYIYYIGSENINSMESIASNSTQCKKTLRSSSNSDTEASESCNIQPVKRRRKVLKKLAGPRFCEMETQVNETQFNETQINEAQLVDRARALLKCLLDVAVESVFETRLKDSKSPVAANISQSSVTYPTCSKMTSVKEEQQPQLKLLSKKELPELSKFCISDDGGTKCNTLCSIGEESSVMQQNSVKETNLPNDNGIFPNIESNLNKQQHNDVNALYGDGENTEESLQMFDAKAGEQNEENNMSLQSRIQEAQSDSNAAKQVEHPDQKGDFSDDLVNAIKRIESRILAFQLCSNLSGSTKNSAGLHTTHEAANSDCPVIKRNNGASGSQMNSGKSLLDGRRLVNQKTCNESSKGENSISSNALVEPFCAVNGSLSQSQMANQNRWHHNGAESAKSIDIPQQIGTKQASVGEWLRSRNRIQNSVQNIAMIDRVKSLKRLVSGDAYFGSQASECIQGLRVPLNQDEHTKKHSMLVSKTNRESMVRLNPVAWSKTDQNRKEKGSESSYAQKLAGSKALISGREKPPLHQMVMKPTLLDQRSSEIKVSSHEHRDSRVLDRRITHKTGHLEPRKTRVLPQDHKLEEANSNSDSFRLSSWQGSANSSSDSEDYSLPDGTQYPSSAMMVDSAYEGSSEESNNSYLKKEGGTSRRFGSFKPYRHHRERNPKETVGRLRRLKNKLGLIFHHHHHHHHYHHHDDDVHGHRHTMWNQLQNVFHHKVKHGVTTNKVDKTRRGAVARVLPQRNHVGQFHRLAEGVLRHIRHSKKPNPFKLDGMKQLRNGHSQKKLRWWQNLRPHRRVRLKKKGRVKMGFMSQKSLKNY